MKWVYNLITLQPKFKILITFKFVNISIVKKLLLVFLFGTMISFGQEPLLKIGLVADPQYANQPTRGKRYYKESLWKIEEAVDTFNYKNVDFVQSSQNFS